MKKKQNTLSRVITYIGKYKYLLPVSIFFALLIVAVNLLVPYLIGEAIDLIVSRGNVDIVKITEILLYTVLLIGCGALSQWLLSVINNRITYRVLSEVRRDAFNKLSRLPISYLDRTPNGDVLSRITADSEQLADGLLLGFTQMFTGILTIVGTLCMLLVIDYRVALTVVILTPLSLLVARFIANRSHSLFVEQSKAKAKSTAFINERLEGQKIIKSFAAEDETLSEFEKINDEAAKISTNAVFFSSLVNPTTRFVNSIVYAATALFGSLIAIFGGGTLLIGELSCLLAYANQYTKPFNEISGVVAEFQNALASASRVFALMDESEEESDEGKLEIGRAVGEVSFKDVSFSYTAEKPLLKNISLEALAGKRVAIVGPTGSGKTTLINLLMRFYDVDGGVISLDGEDIRNITRHSLRANYGMVLQDTWFQSGTVKELISLSKPDATDEEIVAAAKAAHADGFIKRLPNGYDTLVGDGGVELSQGQGQLLSIARIMLKLPPVLILDEATSNIDTRTEMKINSAFLSMMKGRTSFIVAHRLSTIRNADLILVMRDGNIVETGTHKTLIEKRGFYYELLMAAKK